MVNHIIYDEEKVLEFYENIIKPIDLSGDKALILFLTSRGKYYEEPLKKYVKSDNFFNKYLLKHNDPILFTQALRKLNLDPKTYLVRLKMTKNEWDALPEEEKERILNLVKEVKFMTAYDKKGKKDIYVYIHPPVNTMSIYIDLNPKSTITGTINAVEQAFKQMKNLNTLNLELINNSQTLSKERLEELEMLNRWFKRFQSVWLSEVHKSSAGRPPYFLIDVDSKNEELLNWVESIMGEHLIARVHTRNGYHLIYPNTKKLRAIAYTNIIKEAPKKVSEILGEWDNTVIEIKKETMTLIPGTLQGGFKVKADF